MFSDSGLEGWNKSSYSVSGACVEARFLRDSHVFCRDSKKVEAAGLRFSTDLWSNFIVSLASTIDSECATDIE